MCCLPYFGHSWSSAHSGTAGLLSCGSLITYVEEKSDDFLEEGSVRSAAAEEKSGTFLISRVSARSSNCKVALVLISVGNNEKTLIFLVIH